MKAKVLALFVLTAAIASALSLSGLPRQNGRKPAARRVKLLGGILVPGNRLRWDIAWVDQSTARLYLGEAGNAGVDVFWLLSAHVGAGAMVQVMHATVSLPVGGRTVPMDAGGVFGGGGIRLLF